MATTTRLHFFTLVLIFLTLLSVNGVALQTDAARLPKFATKDATYGSMKRSGSIPRGLEQKDINNPGSRMQRPQDKGIKNSAPSTPQNEDSVVDTRSNPRPRVMGHGHYRTWRYQPSGFEEEENMEGREVIIRKKGKHSYPKGLIPSSEPIKT